MLHLLDANALIDANRDYYPIGRVDEFWEWLAVMGERGLVKVPQDVYDKVIDANDDLSKWLKANRGAMLLEETVDEELIAQVIVEGYAPNLTDVEIEKLNEDPFLIAYALADVGASPSDLDREFQTQCDARQSQGSGCVRTIRRNMLQHVQAHTRAGFSH